jgi:hypothetical protein
MKTPTILLNPNPTRLTRTRLRVPPQPAQRLLVAAIAMDPLGIELLARQPCVPGDLVREAHGEVAGGADDAARRGGGGGVELSVLACWAQAPAEGGVGGEEV